MLRLQVNLLCCGQLVIKLFFVQTVPLHSDLVTVFRKTRLSGMRLTIQVIQYFTYELIHHTVA